MQPHLWVSWGCLPRQLGQELPQGRLISIKFDEVLVASATCILVICVSHGILKLPRGIVGRGKHHRWSGQYCHRRSYRLP